VWVLLDDQNQLAPTIKSTEELNRFVDQLRLSLFAPLIKAGHPSEMLEYQARMIPSISQIVSRVFYRGKVQDSSLVMQRPAPITVQVEAFKLERFSRCQPMTLINVEDSQASVGENSTSVTNPKQVEVIDQLVLDLLQSQTIKASEVLILTPYQNGRDDEEPRVSHRPGPKG
jgi:superfamily I DNA and/or RNA helicase